MSHTILSLSASLGVFAAASTVLADNEPPTATKQQFSPRQLVEALHAAFGSHHARAVHTKGILLEGTFAPSPEAASLTIAPHLQQTASKLVVRFSDFTGLPDIPDNAAAANPRGLAIRFTLPDGTATDLVGHSFNGFPTATSDEFRELLMAIATSGPTAAKPTALDRFLEAHPIARTFLTTQKTPASYATIAYYGVSSFQFTSKAGASRYIRYQLVPEAGEHTLSEAEAARMGASYLLDEIKARVASNPLRFTMYAQLAEAGDPITDPSIAWPDTRKRVPLGTLTIDRLGANTPEQDRGLAFSPDRVPQGIKLADPMLTFRAKAYPISVKERR